ncbi:MAG: HAMP domain-containing histidine kinase [Clostridia bacterium]|nr:HAMP domain-containing histidine kinase [Clostridia bacterium]
MLWAAFSAMALLIVVTFGVMQHTLMKRTYREQVARDVTEKGRQIEISLQNEPPAWLQGNLNAYVWHLARTHEVNVFVLNSQGHVLFPVEGQLDQSNPEFSERYDFTQELETLKEKLEANAGTPAVYPSGEEYVYGAQIRLQNWDAYLYVSRSTAIWDGALGELVWRTLAVGALVMVLAFAVSSTISGWLIKPIVEMTDKAKRFAAGDYNVDFHGNDYGSEMVELADTLNFARDEISKADSMQRELIANVSHDFKTPLTMIKAYSSMIIEISGDNPEKRNKHAQVILDEADRLASLVEDVLDISKLRSGIDVLKMTSFDLSAYVYEVLDRFAYLKEKSGYVFETDVDENINVYADEMKIGQVLYNLIGNAVNYTGEDKKVSVKLKRRTVDGTEFAEFSVTDTGAGIPEEDRANIWARYYRSSEMHKRPVKGTGLGLSIVKTVLDKHGFSCGVKSADGGGSTFFVVFPVLKEEAVGDDGQTGTLPVSGIDRQKP